MKIVFLITRLDTVGGAQIHVRDLASSMKKSGHMVYVITGKYENVHDCLYQVNIPLVYIKHLIRDLNIVADIKAFWELRKVLKKIQPDILAIHSSKAGILGRLVGWTLRIPTVFTAHGWSFTEGVPKRKKWLYLLLEKMVGPISDGVITVSEYDKELALKYKVLPARKIITIHNGVHDYKCQQERKNMEKIPRLIMVARFSPPKKQLHLLNALNQIRDIEWNMYFVGEGPLMHAAQEFVKSEKLSERVFFLGNRTDIPELLGKSDVFVLLSDWEGLPLSILEAMVCGLPIISSDVGGVKEAVMQSVNGYLVSKNDTKDLVSKLTLLLTNLKQRREMGIKGRLHFEENFTFGKMQKNTLTYYEKIVNNKK